MLFPTCALPLPSCQNVCNILNSVLSYDTILQSFPRDYLILRKGWGRPRAAPRGRGYSEGAYFTCRGTG